MLLEGKFRSRAECCLKANFGVGPNAAGRQISESGRMLYEGKFRSRAECCIKENFGVGPNAA